MNLVFFFSSEWLFLCVWALLERGLGPFVCEVGGNLERVLCSWVLCTCSWVDSSPFLWSAERQIIFLTLVCTRGTFHIPAFWNTWECVSGWHHWNSEQNTCYSHNYDTGEALLRKRGCPGNTPWTTGWGAGDVSFTNQGKKEDWKCLFILEFQSVQHQFSNPCGRIWRSLNCLINT